MSRPLLSASGAAGSVRVRSDPRSPASRAARLLAALLILAGSLAILDAGVTLVWQEPVSALMALFEQQHLDTELRHVESAPETPVVRRELASIPDQAHRVAFLARQLQAHARNGSAVGRILIPRIGASFVVVKGTGAEELESGPGLYSETSFPGIPGTTAIAGHRTTYLAPFRHIDELRYGDTIELRMPYANLLYHVLGQRVVAPTDVAAAISRVSYSRLVLSACTPLFSAEKRILVFARLALIVPRGAARALGPDRIPRTIDVLRHRHTRVRSPAHRLRAALGARPRTALPAPVRPVPAPARSVAATRGARSPAGR